MIEINDNKLGVMAFGVKTGIITFDDNIVEVVKHSLKDGKDIIKDKDIVCITEAVVAITQKNIVKIDEIAQEIRKKLKNKCSKIGVLFPILSRNRFSMILKAIAKATNKGKVVVQLYFPTDEQGNPVIEKEYVKKLNKRYEDKITIPELKNYHFNHPFTNLDYIDIYKKIIEKEGAKAEIFLSNLPEHILSYELNGIIVSNVSHRKETKKTIKKLFKNCIGLEDLFCERRKKVFCDYGLLGSNILDPEKEILKLAPRNGDIVCEKIKKMIKKEFRKNVEVIIYGDGAYKDPETGIYELADPVSVFGVTKNIDRKDREGVKSKYLMQKYYKQGLSKEEIEKKITEEKKKAEKDKLKNNFSSQGTTPRKVKNLAASLADLVSGSADENTPMVIVRGFLK